MTKFSFYLQVILFAYLLLIKRLKLLEIINLLFIV